MDYLKIWVSFLEVIEPLNDGERGRLFTSMLEYAKTGTMPEFKGNERFIWPMAKQTIDRARAESDRLTVNGSKGGRPKKNQQKPTESNENQQEPTESQKEKDKENNKEKEIEKETVLSDGKEKTHSRFTPPTVDEVAAYCPARGNGISAQRFHDFYAAKGWRVGNQPMKDWRACVRTWEGRDGPGSGSGKPGKTVSAQQYGQRKYTEAELLAVSDDLIAEARAARCS